MKLSPTQNNRTPSALCCSPPSIVMAPGCLSYHKMVVGCWNCIALGNCTPVLCALLIFQLKETFSLETEYEHGTGEEKEQCELYNYLFILQRRRKHQFRPFPIPFATLCPSIIQMYGIFNKISNSIKLHV